MLGEFALAGRATHTEVFQCSAESGKLMSLEMGAGNQGVCVCNLGPDVYLFENFPVYSHLLTGIAPQAVGDDEGGIYHCIVEAVLDGYGEVRYGLCPLSTVKGIGIGEEWFCLALFHTVYNLPDEDRPDKSGIPFFPKVQFDGNQAASLDPLCKTGLIQQGVDFIKEISLQSGFQTGKKHLTLHNES